MKKSNKTKIPRTELRNGCSRTEVFFSPENFKQLRNNSDLQKDWFVECRFHDPKFIARYPDGFQFRKRTNSFKTLSERKEAMKIYKENMEALLDNQNYNPISKKYMSSDDQELSPYIDVTTALETARKKINGSEKHLKQIRRCVSRINEAMKALNYSYLNIGDIKLWHIKNALEYLKIPPYSFNKFKQYLKDVFDELIEYGAVEHNPCRDISKKKFEKQLREIITEEQLAYIDPYLKQNYPDFYRYRMIFGMSGGRSAELFRVQLKHIDIENQEYIVQIQKGRSYVWETKIIVADAIPYWEELLNLSGNEEDFLFAKGLVPGPVQIDSEQITRRWKRLVKDSDKILDEQNNIIKVTADFYTLKHLFLDKLDEMKEQTPIIPLAKIMGNHKSDKMTKFYTTGRSRRENEILKTMKFG